MDYQPAKSVRADVSNEEIRALRVKRFFNTYTPISLEIIEISKKKIGKMFLYIVVSNNKNFSEIKKIFFKNSKKHQRKYLLYFFGVEK